MKKLGLFMMFAAAMVLSSCNNLGDDWFDPNQGGNGDDNTGNNGNGTTEQVDPAGTGTEADPYNVAKALTVQDGSMAWVKGYIVGQIAGDINVAEDVQFEAPFKGATYDDGTVATAGTNLLVAADANETQILKCLVVQLPKGDVRTALELVNNPTNDGKAVELYGKLTKYFGVAGLKETAAAKFDGTTIGTVPSEPTTPPADAAGDGSENNPYNVTAAMANQNGAVAWVKGFIVGHVAGSSISSESQFDAPFTGAVYDDGTVATQGTNILMAATATENNPSACFVVQLPKGDVRTALDILAHPEIDGKEVAVYGKLTKYFGVAGMKETSAYKLDGEGGGNTTPDEPANPEVGDGNGTKDAPYNVAAVIELNNSGAKAWVKAYIVGQINGKSVSNVEWEAPFGVADGSTQGTNIVIADAVDEQTTIVPVQLPSGAVRNALSLPDHPELDGKEVLLYGELIKYFGVCGIKNTTCAIVDGVVYGKEPSNDQPTDNGDAILSISFTSGLGGFTAYSVSGEQVWSSDKTYGAKMSGFANSASHANEDWLISPALDLSGKSNVAISFEHAINKGDVANLTTNHTLWMSTDYNGGDPTTATWTQVDITTYPDGKSWTYVPSDNIVVPAEFLAANARFAFKYLCSDAESATWEIRDLVVK